MFNTKQNQKIKRLENRITDLERQLQYYDLPADSPMIWWPVRPENLTASSILRRFDELYNHLGIERKIEPAKPETPKLTKIKKD